MSVPSGDSSNPPFSFGSLTAVPSGVTGVQAPLATSQRHTRHWSPARLLIAYTFRPSLE